MQVHQPKSVHVLPPPGRAMYSCLCRGPSQMLTFLNLQFWLHSIQREKLWKLSIIWLKIKEKLVLHVLTCSFFDGPLTSVPPALCCSLLTLSSPVTNTCGTILANDISGINNNKLIIINPHYQKDKSSFITWLWIVQSTRLADMSMRQCFPWEGVFKYLLEELSTFQPLLLLFRLRFSHIQSFAFLRIWPCSKS